MSASLDGRAIHSGRMASLQVLDEDDQVGEFNVLGDGRGQNVGPFLVGD